MQTQNRVGQQFGNYRLTRLIGQGGYAEVYLAQHIHLNTLHAIKILTDTNLKERQREEFLAEARTVANLQHLSPHIIQISDFGIQPVKEREDGGIPYFVMEYAAEGTLRTLYPHDTKMPLDRIVLYVNQVAEALQCAHDQQPPIIHCDVKPENMLLRSEDFLLLSDFGIAVAGKTSTQTTSMREMPVVGTATYIAPERLASKQTSRASDQYSLAIVVYEWLCGFPPFEGLDMEICFKQMTEPPPSFSKDENPHITPGIEAVVMRALKKKPADRYPTVTAFAKALEGVIQGTAYQNQQLRLQPPAAKKHIVESTLVDALEPTRPRWFVAPPSDQKGGEPPVEKKTKRLSSPLVPQPLHLSSSPLRDTLRLSEQQSALSASLTLYEQTTIAASPIPVKQVPTVLSQRNASAVTEVVAPRSISPIVPYRPDRPPVRQTMGEVLGLSSHFLFGKGSWFIYVGILCNVGSAILVGELWSNYTFLLEGLLFSLVMFALSIFLVERILATFFAILVAGYWLVVGWSVGSFLVVLLHLNPFFAPPFASIVFSGISVGLNIWYVARKNL